jgi:hypothetical protein
MLTTETAETTGFQRCQGCGATQIDSDKFCRRCGARLNRRAALLNRGAGSVAEGTLDRAGGGILRRSYSGPLVNDVTQKLSKQTSPFLDNRRATFLIRTLVAAPLWLMIVLLSPLDAYITAKDLARRV